MYTIFVNSEGILKTINKKVRLCSSVPIKARTANEYTRALRLIIQHYNKGGIQVVLIHCDGEYKSILNPIKDKLDMDMNFSNPGDHVPEADQNKTIKERIWATSHRLPYKAIPCIMVRSLVMYCIHKLNMFPAKGGISRYYSP